MIYAHSLTCRESPESLAVGSKTTFVIAGLGKFGCLALERLRHSFPHSRIMVSGTGRREIRVQILAPGVHN